MANVEGVDTNPVPVELEVAPQGSFDSLRLMSMEADSPVVRKEWHHRQEPRCDI